MHPRRITVFLAGPFRSADNLDYREREKSKLKGLGFKVLDPISEVGDLRSQLLEPGIAKEVVEGDSNLIKECDLFLAYTFKTSTGTGMEALIAKLMGKKVVAVTLGEKSISPWIVYFADLVIDEITPETAKAMANLIQKSESEAVQRIRRIINEGLGRK